MPNEVDILLRVPGQSIESLREGKAAVDGIRASAALGSAEFKAASQQSAAYATAIKQANLVSKEYGQTLEQGLRQQLRGMRFEHRLATETVGALALVMGDSKGPLKEFAEGIFGVKFAADALSNGLRTTSSSVLQSIGAGLGAMALPLALATAGMTALASANSELSDRLEKAGEALFKLRVELGEIDKQQQLNFVRQQIRDEQAKLGKAGAPTTQSWLIGGITSLLTGGPAGAAAGGAVLEKAGLAQYEEQLVKITELRKQEKDILDAIGKEQKKQADDLAKSNEEEARAHIETLANFKRLAPYLLASGQIAGPGLGIYGEETSRAAVRGFTLGAPPTTLQKMNLDVTATTGVGPGTGKGGLYTVEDELKKDKLASESFNQSLQHMANLMSTQTADKLGQGFVNAFSIGHTLLGQFAQDFIDTMAKLAEQKVFTGIFNWITGGFGGNLFGLIGQAFSGGGSKGIASSGVYTPGSNATSIGSLIGAIGSMGQNFKLVAGYDQMAFVMDRASVAIAQRRST